MSSIDKIMEKLDLLTTVIQWDPVKKGLILRLAKFTLENAYFRIFGKVYRQTRYRGFKYCQHVTINHRGMPMGGHSSRCAVIEVGCIWLYLLIEGNCWTVFYWRAR